MAGRTFAIGDIHGELGKLRTVMSKFPPIDAQDTLVFLGDYVNRGPDSRGVLDTLQSLKSSSPAKVIFLRGNHEDAWLRVRQEGWDEFVFPPDHGCFATLRSFLGGPPPEPGEKPNDEEMGMMASGEFLPEDVIQWMGALPFWYEDEHAIYVHAGLPKGPKGFLHPKEVYNPTVLAWVRTDDFTRNYHGKRVVFGHTPVAYLPPELSDYTPEDPTDVWQSDSAIGLDTGCGKSGFLTGIELPSGAVFESR
ncbi:MAG: serine/threonine protein phosphatase [Opitutaceae bacterium]|nr:serine/threonine protein phosphatase [Opitutaceae bacterium]